MTDAQLRTVGITARPHPMGRYGLTDLLINVDGVEHIGRWNTRGAWQIAADRPVSIAVAMRNMGSRKYFGAAQLVLPPGGQPAELGYRPPAYFSAPGALGPTGTVVHNGKDSYAKFVGITVAIAAVFAVGLPLGLLLFFM